MATSTTAITITITKTTTGPPHTLSSARRYISNPFFQHKIIVSPATATINRFECDSIQNQFDSIQNQFNSIQGAGEDRDIFTTLIKKIVQ